MISHLDLGIAAAREAGELLRQHFGQTLAVHAFEAHDIKLDLDVHAQDLITRRLLDACPDHALYGEEGIAGNQSSEWQWIVDPIDGTVNFFYGIPHFCISIALRHRDEIRVGVIYDPMRDELWAVEQGGAPTLNGRLIAVSTRTQLSEAMLSVGLSKTSTSINTGLPFLEKYARRARKCRLMGSAALDLAYVACGRLDAYIEQSVSLWDVAAGKILVEAAGGHFTMTAREDNPNKISVVASSGRVDLDV
ncbi:MAG: inositol monophosphatase [Verrucomicrobiota bacterium]|nr:inositol monophosphatase [Verrucomicrobiota bacterium]